MAPSAIPPFLLSAYGSAVQKTHSDGTTPSSAVLHRNLHSKPPLVVSASGIYLTLDNGLVILDASCGAAVSCLGHGHPRIKAAVAKQQEQVSYCHSFFFGTAAAEELAKELIAGTGGKMSRVFVVGSGSEAMDAAMKLARQYFLELSTPQPQRIRFIARHESYHGTTLGSLSMGGHVGRRTLFEPMLLDNITHVSACNAYRGMRDGEDEAGYVARLAEELDQEFQRVGADTVCAFVAEPVVGAALGCVPAVPGYFKAMKEVCDRHGALLIFDEVMSGMGRCGTLHAWEQEDVIPDIQTIGKGLGGGYAPVAGLLINHKVVDVLDKGTGSFMHGQTYQGHPITCAVALEVQREIREKKLVDNVREMGVVLSSLLIKNLAAHPHVGNIRGRGLFWGIEFVKDKSTKEPFDPRLGVAVGIHERGMERYSISLYPGTGTVPGGVSGDHILIAPAYNVTREDIEEIASRSTQAIESYFADLRV